MTTLIPRGVDSTAEASPRSPTRSTKPLYLAVPRLKIHNQPKKES